MHARAGTRQLPCTSTRPSMFGEWHYFCLISFPLWPLLLSFPTCLWSTGSFTFQSTACSSSSWQRSEHSEKEGELQRGSCPLWVAKRLPFERSNPLHHISHSLLSSLFLCGNRFPPDPPGNPVPLFFTSSYLFIFTSGITPHVFFNPIHKQAI